MASTLASGQSSVPALVIGEMPSTEFQSESNLKNVLIGSIFASSSVDDNIQNLTSNTIPGGQYYLGAMAAFQITRRHVKWDFSYQPSVGIASHGALNQYNQGINHDFGTTLELAPTPRLSLHLRQDYLVTTDPFQHLGENAVEAPIGPLGRPNESVVLPQLQRTSLLSAATVSYRISKHTTAGVGATYYIQHYGDVVEGSSLNSPLLNSKSPSGYVFLGHQWSRRQTVGAQYRYSQFNFPDADQRTVTHVLLIFDQIRLSEHNNLTVLAGPQYAQVAGQLSAGLPNITAAPLHQHTLSTAAGLVYTFSTGRNMFQASYARQVSDGGGLTTTVLMSSASLTVGRRFTRQWVSSLGITFTDNSPLIATQPSYGSVNANIALSRNIRNSFVLSVGYERLSQSSNSLYGGNHNRATISMGYSFSKPLGR